MARMPKIPPAPTAAIRGRKLKKAELAELALGEGGDAEDAKAIESKAVPVTVADKPARGKPGPKPKPRAELFLFTSSEVVELQPATNLGHRDATPDPTLDRGEPLMEPVGTEGPGSQASNGPVPDGAHPLPSQGLFQHAGPAAHWDRAADVVWFDWPQIERTASQDGLNQVIAKVLVAARAEGANSRWPL